MAWHTGSRAPEPRDWVGRIDTDNKMDPRVRKQFHSYADCQRNQTEEEVLKDSHQDKQK